MCYSVTHDVNSSQHPTGDGRATGDDALLDAAREAILAVGWRRTTLTDVARRAGVSRMTIYRRWPDMQTLLADLMTREWSGARRGRRARRRGVAAASGSPTGSPRPCAALRANELFRKIVEVDPELLLPYLLDRRGRTQDALLALLEAGDRRGPAPTARSAPATRRLLARSRAARRPRLRALRADDDRRPTRLDRGDLDGELRALVERYLRAMTATSRRARGTALDAVRRAARARRGRPTAAWSTCSSSGSASPAPASPSTPPPAGSTWSRSTPTTSPSAPRGGAPSSSTAGCATSPTARSASPTRAPSSAAS